MTGEPDEYELTWWQRWMCRNRYTLWLGSWLGVARCRWQRLYDDVMIRVWPYDRFPKEWRSLFERKDHT